MKKNILVTGSHRSGTTWVGRTITQHRKARYVQEPFNVNHSNRYMMLQLENWYSDYDYINLQQQSDIEASFSRLFDMTPYSHAVANLNAQQISWRTFPRGVRDILSETIFSPSILVKDPLALFSAGWLYKTYDLYVVCMIRNPMAFVGSLKKAGWEFDFNNFLAQENLIEERLLDYKNDIKLCIDSDDFIFKASILWNILHYIIIGYKKSYPDWMFVKYEEIALDPISEYKKIFDYVQLDFHDGIIQYIDAFTTSQSTKNIQTNSYVPRDSIASLSSYKSRLSPKEIEDIKSYTAKIGSVFYPELYLK